MAHSALPSSSQYDRIVKEVKPFLDADSTIPDDVETAVRSLKARPPAEAVHDPLPVDEMETRLQLAAQIQAKIFPDAEDEYHLTAFELSTTMLAPLVVVQKWAGDDGNGGEKMLGIERVVRRCVWSLPHHRSLTNQDDI